jgi:hypothetical protein
MSEMRDWLPIVSMLIGAAGIQAAEPFHEVQCDGDYQHHLQGVCTSEDSVFWCFTSEFVKTDPEGKVLKKIPVPGHHGDLCYHDGKVFVAVNLGKFNRAPGEANSWVYVYNAEDLSLLTRHPVQEAVHGAGGIAFHDGRFIVVGGLPKEVEENYVFEYDTNFKFVKKHVLKSGYTLLGIQTAAFADGHWWFGCYGKTLLKADESLSNVERFPFDLEGSVGIVPLSKGRFLVARGGGTPEKRYTGRLVLTESDPEQGLVIPGKMSSTDWPRWRGPHADGIADGRRRRMNLGTKESEVDS